ncbi:hypothetical protein KY342_06370 [Candidatus Woesearchaeota archaeon]|nr:hypothetical protein [Candidatus Woesearchaeota archaeon]
MDANLICILKSRGLFPLEIDEEAQQRYRAQGKDPSRLEKHFSPGTPASVIERDIRIETNVLELYQLEQRGLADSEDYRRKEEEIRIDLYELDHPTQRDVLEKMMRPDPMTGAVTGIDGVNRDIFPATGSLNAGHTIDYRIIDPNNSKE